MIYFTLPNLYDYHTLALAIYSLNKTPEKLKMPVQFIATYESIPYCYLAGGININQGLISKYHDLENKARQHFGMAKRLNFSNLNIEEQDIKDEYFNVILNFTDNKLANTSWTTKIDKSTITFTNDRIDRSSTMDLYKDYGFS